MVKDFLFMLKNIIMTIIMNFATSISYACDPSEPLSLEKSYDEADIVVLGFVTKAEPVRPQNLLRSLKGFRYVHVYFDVIETVKGSVPKDSFVMSTNDDPSLCGLPIGVGLHYMFFIHKSGPSQGTDYEGAMGEIDTFMSKPLPNDPTVIEKEMRAVRALNKTEP